ncbi:MAG: cytochrome b [Roseomonas sp.]|nr:cytochrome b [Roseomonas sp.]MCA3291627.1 cytochrome b [Roseomonas sp.]MCA3293991.1 cytochrome b [Roseomonas sp.]
MLRATRWESAMDGMAGLPPKGTDAAHPAGQYGAIAKLFHWVTLSLMLVALPLGFVIQHVKDASKMGFYALHESAGLTILFVAVARLIWRWLSPPPTQPSDMPKLMRIASAAVHHALYALLIIQPLLGFMATNAWGFPMRGATAYLGFIEFPKFMEAWESLAKILSLFHTIGGWLLVVLIVLHVGGALFHHAIRRDGTLMRMI